MTATIDVLVVDDSPLMQRLITKLLESDTSIRVVSTAADGYEAIEKVKCIRPDVLTLDIEMPRLDGLDALQHIMKHTPTPIIILSGAMERDAAMQALEMGAVDFVAKPSGIISIDLYKIREKLIKKVKLATLVNPKCITGDTGPVIIPTPTLIPPKNITLGNQWLIAIGASTGGPRALNKIISGLPPDLPASMLIVQHMPANFTKSFAQRLNNHSPLHVTEATHGQRITSGVVYIAPGGVHTAIAKKNHHLVINIQDTPPVNSVRPSADVLMNSIVKLQWPRLIGILLTGMGNDGADGLAKIKAAGGHTIAQDKDSSTIFGMPKAAIQRGVVDETLPLNQIPSAIIKLIQKSECHDR
ncbi:MAG: chemotaxis response regulator protein-glutamate methylesterase [Chloroflexota bacterium]|nr:chemotaxis response regulator protein-glutamate methylesterase [Chloroflexota bacterium]